MIQRRRSVLQVESGAEVHEARQRRQAAEPAAAAAAHPEVEAGSEGVGPARVGLDEDDRRFRDDKRDVPLQPNLEAPPLVLDAVAARG